VITGMAWDVTLATMASPTSNSVVLMAWPWAPRTMVVPSTAMALKSSDGTDGTIFPVSVTVPAQPVEGFTKA
jgi:hypothetical protein